jgi:biotin carboxyl carrier protein
MLFEVDIGGRARAVSVERAGGSPGRFRVLVDGTEYLVGAARIGDYDLSLTGELPSTLSADVQVTPAGGRGEVLVSIAGRVVAATVNGRRTGRTAEARAHPAGEQSVSAPMPGRVVRVLVTAGDEVAARQPVVVVEAMKMENELRAPKPGRVKEVTVAPGMSVDAGKVLVVIE